MTIKELENRTGMTRTNIRFYESEGLLFPKRLENGYRDYSEEDARTLEKIRLLRQLQMDLETIRLVQRGGLTLEQALFSQLTKLEGDKTVIERAAQVCRELEQSGVEYGALEPEPWLFQLQQPPKPGIQPPAPKSPVQPPPERDNTPRACCHPWQRYFARALDMLLYDTAINVLWLATFHDLSLWTLQRTWIGVLLSGPALLFFALAVEPLWLRAWGWTPGKWAFGLKVRDRDGKKLTLAQGWKRSMGVGWSGYCWDIPILRLFSMWIGRKDGLAGYDCPWDADEGFRYTKVERRVKPAAVYIVAAVLCIGAQAAALRWAELPRNMGELTVEGFIQNYNQFHDQYASAGFSYVPGLDRDGHWTEPDGHISTVYGSYASITQDGVTYTVENPVEGTTIWAQPEFAVEDGRMTAVTLRWESWDSIVDAEMLRVQLCLMALSGTAEGVGLFRFDPSEWYFALWDVPPFQDQELDFRGLHISQRVEYEGYVSMGSTLWTVDEHAPYHCVWSMTISVPK